MPYDSRGGFPSKDRLNVVAMARLCPARLCVKRFEKRHRADEIGTRHYDSRTLECSNPSS